MVLNITSGEMFNSYISEINDGIYLPFNEAMIEGKTTLPIFSDSFISIRSKTHEISKEYYIVKLGKLLDINFINSFDEINLWFGYDSFCQINMLTLLAYLKQIGYIGNLKHIAIDDETREVLSINNIKNNFFDNTHQIYTNVLINKEYYKTNCEYMNKAIKDYLSIYNGTDIVSDYVRKNPNKSCYSLLIDCLEMTREMGLGDTQIINIIKKIRGNNHD